MMTMEKEVAAASKNSYDVVSALYDDLIAKVQKYATTAEESEEGIAEANKVKSAKMKLVEEQFQQWQLKSTGGVYQKIDEEQKQTMMKWGSQHGDQIKGIFDTQRSAEDLKVQEESYQTIMKSAEAVRSLTLSYVDQGKITTEINATQKEIATIELERQVLAGKYNDATGAVNQKLVQQQKTLIELNKEAADLAARLAHPEGIAGGLEKWAHDRPQPAQRDAEGVQSAMKGLEQQGGQMFGQMISAGLTGKRMDFMKIGQDMATRFANKAGQMLMSHLMDVFQNVIGNAFTTAATQAGTVLTTAGKGIETFIQQGADFLMQAGQSIASMLSSILSNIGGGGGGGILGDVVGGIGDALGFLHSGGLVMHDGGMVPWVVAHNGLNLAHDEIPAILQKGEYVLPRSVVSHVGAHNLDSLRHHVMHDGGLTPGSILGHTAGASSGWW